MQSAEEVFNVFQQWKFSGKCPQQFLVAGSLDSHFEALLDDFIQTKCRGVYSQNNLEMASIWVLMDAQHKASLTEMEHKLKTELAEKDWRKRLKDVNNWIAANPNFKSDDEALAVIKEFFTAHPEATLDEWNTYTLQHPDDKRLWATPKPLVINVRNMTKAQIEEAKRVYGDAPVQKALDELTESMRRGLESQTWRETPQDIAKRHAKETAEEKERQRLATEQSEKKAKAQFDFAVEGFKGKSHSESFHVRALLREMTVNKPNSADVDWQASTAKVAAYLASYEHKNPGVLPSGMR